MRFINVGVEHFKPYRLTGNFIAIFLSSLFTIFICGFFYTENVSEASYATVTPANVILPLHLYLIFHYFKWNHTPSASIYLLMMVLSVAMLGHKNFYHDSSIKFAKIFRENIQYINILDK